ncbi:uncharacterized protein BJ171DRAFT_175458 [Polychytrium aggregatum]|uniref:uncharacterized protein n=1 Tax=Polychytrium aggregatum TaxID=110093 RepID=UPI0022FDB108|nr:uncharacterized protein BJ171DRAFT_175458 [Polychytrium aggregatum]KAI9209114.1 hypothetical protein BJ171DRAFT_175458 [Polychytrium aggregatum]
MASDDPSTRTSSSHSSLTVTQPPGTNAETVAGIEEYQPEPPRPSQKLKVAEGNKSALSSGVAALSAEIPQLLEPQDSSEAASASAQGCIRCTICNRSFSVDRIETHTKVCRAHQRNQQQRELRRQARAPNQNQREALTTTSDRQPRSSNWREQHEELVHNLREAKKFHKHMANGGRPADLPPPKPSAKRGIECLYCHRYFSEKAADRHISVCAKNMHRTLASKPNGAKA